jgi:hypothetical protein
MSEDNKLDDFRKILEQPVKGKPVPHRACICDKLLNATEHTLRRHSGVVNFEECLCPDCRKEFDGFVRVVCLGCKSLVALQKPDRLSTGFEFKRGGCVHVQKCPSCSPNITVLPVLEHIRFCRERGIPTNVDLDIVQEAEQKALQAQEEAAKMRAELKEFPAP